MFNGCGKVSKKKAMKRIEWIDMLKGIGVVLVVVGHFYNNEVLLRIISSFHMPLFFFASGYLYKQRGIIEGLKSKIHGLLKPYFFFAILSMIAWGVLSSLQGKEFELFAVVKGYLWGDYSSIIYNRVLWFIPAFFCIITLYNLSVNLIGTKGTWGVATVLVGLRVANVAFPNLPWGIDESLALYFPFVAMGNMLATFNFDNAVRKSNSYNKCFYIIALFLTHMLIIFKLERNSVTNLCVSAVGICLYSIFCIVFERHGEMLKELGRASLVIMGVQVPIYDAFSKGYRTLLRISYEECLANEFHAAICCMVTLLFCYSAYILILRKRRMD